MIGTNALDATAFRVSVPILKSLPSADDGAILHRGIASDESLDLQGEAVGQHLVAKSYDYLERHGKHNWDHGNTLIGEVFEVQSITPDEAEEKYGLKIEKSATEIAGNVYPLDGRNDPEDLEKAHYFFRKNARLAYSLDGVARRDSTGAIKSLLVPRVAICPQPVNANTVCQKITKSLRGALADIQVSDEDLPHVLADLEAAPDILIDCEGPAGPMQKSVQVLISETLFDFIVRKAFGPRGAPPLGKYMQEPPARMTLAKAMKAFREAS